MVWQCYGMSEYYGHTIKRGKWRKKKEYLKKWEGTLLVYSVLNITIYIYIFTQETN